MKLSILITLLNEELVLPQTHREISNQLEKMLGKELSDYEILYIDDGSSDKTFELTSRWYTMEITVDIETAREQTNRNSR